ncbi:MAG: nitroreductase [Betaproteobacteria bacterium]|nr:nitroreductase [Betaproteobacteria bacterium]
MKLGSIMMWSMVIDMNDEQVHTLAQMQAFVHGTVALDLAVAAQERYGFIARTVRRKMRILIEMDSTADQEVLDAALTLIHTRQHTSPKRLGDPGPDSEQIEKILSAAGAAPDHGLLNPWRLIIIAPERRPLLGEAFAQALTERDGDATEVQKQDARAKAFRGPFLLLVVARLDPDLGATHPQERLISAGCAIQNMLLTAHAMGFGAGLSSGRALYSQQMRSLFGLSAHEQPLCFLTLGTVTKAKAPRPRPLMADYTSTL